MSQMNVSVLIISHQTCTKFEQLALNSFHEQLKDFEGFSSLIKNAKAIMRISTYNKAFLKDFLRVKVSSFDWSHLTIVNLSRLIHFKTKQQFAFDVELVQNVI